MPRLKNTVLAGAAIAVVAWLPTSPAVADGPLLLAPWALRHIVAPLIIGAATSFQPQASYTPGPGYYGGSAGYYAPPGYAQPPRYYAPSPSYYTRGYYAPAAYGPAFPRTYSPPRGVYPQRLPYHANYGGHESYRSGGFGNHRW